MYLYGSAACSAWRAWRAPRPSAHAREPPEARRNTRRNRNAEGTSNRSSRLCRRARRFADHRSVHNLQCETPSNRSRTTVEILLRAFVAQPLLAVAFNRLRNYIPRFIEVRHSNALAELISAIAGKIQ